MEFTTRARSNSGLGLFLLQFVANISDAPGSDHEVPPPPQKKRVLEVFNAKGLYGHRSVHQRDLVSDRRRELTFSIG